MPPHEVSIDGQRFVVRGVLDLAGAVRLRLHELGSGGALVIAESAATRDGRPLVGRAAFVAWGEGARLRVRGRRVDVVWHHANGRRSVAAGEVCRLCAGSFTPAEREVATCTCGAAFHDECFELRVSCPACGAPPVEEAP